MIKVKEVLRLRFDKKLTHGTIAQAVEISVPTVERYLRKAKQKGIVWPLPDDMTNEQLEFIFHPPIKASPDHATFDFGQIRKELARKGVTLLLLWKEAQESRSTSQPICSYSQFCHLYDLWKKEQETFMLQTHEAGVETYIDYAGPTISIWDAVTGLIAFEAPVFVSALGASSYIFCEAVRSQSEEDWTGSHKRMSEYYEGVTELWILDNLRAGVTKANRYEPIINQSYLSMGQHYGVTIIPARVRRPKDKSIAEAAVWLVEIKVLAPLRDRKFFSLAEANKAIRELLDLANKEPFQKMPGDSRYSLYLELDKPALKSLPRAPYEFFCWGKTKINPGYHLRINQIPYSVPDRFVGKTVEFRFNADKVEVFFKGELIASHIVVTKRAIS